MDLDSSDRHVGRSLLTCDRARVRPDLVPALAIVWVLFSPYLLAAGESFPGDCSSETATTGFIFTCCRFFTLRTPILFHGLKGKGPSGPERHLSSLALALSQARRQAIVYTDSTMQFILRIARDTACDFFGP